MKWTLEAEAAVKKIPFFVRKKVRKRIEEEARANGCSEVTLEQVKATQRRFLTKMDQEIKGYQVETCFGPNGCPNRAVAEDGLINRIETLLQQADLLTFLSGRVSGKLKFHHEFRVTVADCPNACSQPQIKDIGIIGARFPSIGNQPCTQCHACIATCREDAVDFSALPNQNTHIDFQKCVGCGQCIPVCPSGTILEGEMGYRVQLGGKLGRHPQLARELPGIYSADQVIKLVQTVLDLYKSKCTHGERFGELLSEKDMAKLVRILD